MYKGQIICIIIILFIITFRTFSKQKESAPSKWYTRLLYISGLQILADICSVYTVNHLETVPEVINRIVHIFYMGLLLLIFYLAYKYLESVIEEELGTGIRRFRYTEVPITLANLGVVFLPLSYMETPKGNYSYGPAASMVYIGVACYILLILRDLFRYWKDIPVKKRTAMIIAIGCELGVALYQGAIPTALISCLGITLLNLGIYLTVENPDAMLVEQLAAETKRADVANQAKTNFLANMSHEIRTPINAVLGMNEVILRETKEPAIREYAKDVDGAAKSLLSIINDILDITKIEAGKLTIIPVEYDFSSMVHDVTNMISFKAKKKELEFKVEIEENIPNRLLGDDIRIRQILVNLLNNAVKYTHEGTVTLEVKLLPETGAGEGEPAGKVGGPGENVKLLFAVKDTGIGIKEEDIAKLYVPFERIEEKRNRNIEGTGLGMNITMQLLNMLDSRLQIASEYGKGSEFSFVLEQKIIDARPIGKLGEKLETENIEPDYEMHYQAPEAKLLVVDDNAMNRKVLCSLLKDTKMQIEEASGGWEAIEKVKHTAFDIIFLDHMMPELDGIETLKIMKELSDYPSKNAPVVMLTANAIVGAKEQYLAAGFDDFLTKPIDSKKLETIILGLLDERLVTYSPKTDSTNGAGIVDFVAEKQTDISDLPLVEGIDWNYGMVHLKSQELLMETVKDFYYTIDSEADYLQQYFESFHTGNAEALQQYRIKVHAMKSSSALIGAAPLSGVARLLEYAARDGQFEVIESVTPVFLADWRSYKEKLKSCIPEREKLEITDMAEVSTVLEQLRISMEEMDIDASDAAMENIRQYAFDEEVEKLIDALGTAVINLDSNEVTALVDKILIQIR